MNNTRPLRTALIANAVFSTGCAALMLINPILVGDLLGVQAPFVLQVVGLGLVIFAVDLVHQATRHELAIWRALYASSGDYLWVLGTLLGIVLFPGVLSDSGLAIVLAVAVIVLVFGTWQLGAIHHLRKIRQPDARL